MTTNETKTSNIKDGELMTFLEMAGQGCISGNVSEWPQLKPACAWAHKRIAELEAKIETINKVFGDGDRVAFMQRYAELEVDYFNSGETIVRYVRQLDAADEKIAELEKRIAELEEI